MTEAPALQQGEPDPAAAASPGGAGESMEAECPICYQEYNQHAKCPRVLDCLHVFCTECLQNIQLYPCGSPEPQSPAAIPCPLCRHLTPMESGDALSLPSNSRILARLPPAPPLVAFRLPASVTVTQRVVLSLDGDGGGTHFIILPTVSLRVQQMHVERPLGATPDLAGEAEVMRQHGNTLMCVQLLALVFWVVFVLTCVVGVLFLNN